MATPTFKVFTDAGLTTEFVPPLVNTQESDGSTGDQDYVLYIGSTTVGKTMQATSDPGVDQITFSIVDSVTGTGPDELDVKLALTNGGLTAAVAGASLDVGVSIASEVANALPLHIRISGPALTSGTYNELTITDNGTIEV